jgi:predicted RNA-binding Zn ribbon-like protein
MEANPSGTEHRYELTGGRLCLDFVNTVSGDRHDAPRERLGDYGALISWARQASAIAPEDARRLLSAARSRPADAEAVHRDALLLREALFRIFLAGVEGADPAGDDVARLSATLSRALAHRRLERREGGYTLAWDGAGEALDAPLWPVVASAADLLTSDPERERVRICGLHETRECSWLFMDATRAGTLRWCSMKDCGNKAKARRHYQRTRD